MMDNLARARESAGALIGRPVAKRGGDYEFDGEIRAVIVKRSGAVRYAVEDDRGLLLVMNARQCGLADNPADVLRGIAEGMVDGETIKGVDHASFDRAAAMANEIVVDYIDPEPVPWRLEGVADLAAFRITTGDPRFDPSRPVTINGFLYVPAKENDHG